jgi:hypothetical protein
VLETGIPVTVQLPAELALPPSPIELALVISPILADPATMQEPLHLEDGGSSYMLYNWFIGQAPRFGAEREARLDLPLAGAYRVDWAVLAATTAGAQWPVFLNDAKGDRELRVDESDAGRVFQLAPDAAELTAALERHAALRAR